jgi:starch synthase
MIREEKIRNVRLAGFLNHQEMDGIWSKSACSIIPSIWKEPFGMVVLEAWAKGRPVIAHRIGALPEIISDGLDGLLVSENSPEELAEAIRSLLQNPEKAAEMGRAGWEKLKGRYSQNAWMETIKPILSQSL